MSTEVGRIDLGLGINKQMFNSQLHGISRDAVSKTKSIFGGLGKSIGLTLGAAAVIGFTKSSIGLGSALAEVQNVTDTVFPKMSSRVDSFAQNAIEQFGLSELSAKKYMGQMGAMSSSMGMTEKASYSMAEAVAGLAGDVSSFYNMNSDQAFTKLKSIWTGETESLKELGVIMTQANLDQYALANNFGKTTRAMTEQEKMLLRYQYVMSSLSHAQGDFAKTSDSWANQTRVLSLQFESLKATFGQGLIPMFNPIVKGLNLIMGKLQTAANYFKAFTSLLFGGNSEIEGISSAAAKANESLGGMASGTEGVGSAAKEAGKAIKGSLASFDQLNIIGQNAADSLGGISSGIGGVDGVDFGELVTGDLALPDLALPNLDEYKEAIKKFAENYNFEIKTMLDSGEKLKTNLKEFTDELVKLLGILFGDGEGSNWFTRWLASNASGQIDMMSAVIKIVAANMQILSDILSGDWNNAQGFENLIKGLTDLMSGFFKSFLPPEYYEKIENLVLKFEGMWKTLRGLIIKYGDPTKLEFTDFLEFFKDEFVRQLAGILPAKFWVLFFNIKKYMKSFHKPTHDDFIDFLEGFGKFFKEKIEDSLPYKFFKLGEDIKASIKESFDPVKTYFGEIITAGGELALINMGTFLVDMGKAILSYIPTANKNITDLGDSMANAFSTFAPKFSSVWNSLGWDTSKGWASIGDALLTGFNNIISKINAFLAQYNKIGIDFPDVKIGNKVIEGPDFKVPQMKPWNHIMPSAPLPRIQALASGGLVSAPTLAIVGDNKNAKHDPEVISPLSKLQGMINAQSGNKEMVTLLKAILEAVRSGNTLVVDKKVLAQSVSSGMDSSNRMAGYTILNL